MARFGWLALGVLLLLALAFPSAAAVVEIEKTAPLQDHTGESLRAALETAVTSAITDAVAMGFPWVRMSHARFLETMVTVRVVATDVDPGAEKNAEARGPDTAPRSHADQDHPRVGL
jgi:hypothetical protein